MAGRKSTRCRDCNYVIKEVPVGNGWAHKKKEHWLAHPHKAAPATMPTRDTSTETVGA